MLLFFIGYLFSAIFVRKLRPFSFFFSLFFPFCPTAFSLACTKLNSNQSSGWLSRAFLRLTCIWIGKSVLAPEVNTVTATEYPSEDIQCKDMNIPGICWIRPAGVLHAFALSTSYGHPLHARERRHGVMLGTLHGHMSWLFFSVSYTEYYVVAGTV